MRKEKSNICMEAAIGLRVKGESIVTFMCTPFNLDDMAIGYLLSKGIVEKDEDIVSVTSSPICGIDVELEEGISLEKTVSPKLILSGCGSGMGFDLELLKNIKFSQDTKFSLEEIKTKFIEMLSNATMYQNMGGMHCASLYQTGQEKSVIREHIGRHNAVDKVLGAGMKNSLDFSRSVLLVTGRISSDMVFKAAGAKIPVIASRSIPSDLALSLGEELNLTIIGRAGYEEPIIYIGKERIVK